MDTTEVIPTIAEKKRKKAEEAAASGPRRSTYQEADGSAQEQSAGGDLPKPAESLRETTNAVSGQVVTLDGAPFTEAEGSGLRYDWSEEQDSTFDFEQIEVDKWADVEDLQAEISGNMTLGQLRELATVCEEIATEHLRRAERARFLALRIGSAARGTFAV